MFGSHALRAAYQLKLTKSQRLQSRIDSVGLIYEYPLGAISFNWYVIHLSFWYWEFLLQ